MTWVKRETKTKKGKYILAYVICWTFAAFPRTHVRIHGNIHLYVHTECTRTHINKYLRKPTYAHTLAYTHTQIYMKRQKPTHVYTCTSSNFLCFVKLVNNTPATAIVCVNSRAQALTGGVDKSPVFKAFLSFIKTL